MDDVGLSFTSEQLQVIAHVHGHALVNAVPGSGKTTTLVARVLQLLSAGIDPSQVLVVMFNKTAKEDFTNKLTKRGANAIPDIFTFNGLGHKLCLAMQHQGWLPVRRLETSPGTLQHVAQQALLKVYGKSRLYKNEDDRITDVFLDYQGLCKAHQSSPADILSEYGLDRDYPQLAAVYETFEAIRLSLGIRFFHDQVVEALEVLKSNEQAKLYFENQKLHIIIDEYQDSNATQHELIKMLAGSRASVMAVGDVDQTIYQWRGANPSLLLSGFENDFPDPRSYYLSHTFRFGAKIALLANHVIDHNQQREKTLCLSHNSNTQTDIVLNLADNSDDKVVHLVEDILQQGRPLGDVAILVRLYSSAAAIELSLLSKGIRCHITGNNSVLHRHDIKSLETLLLINANKLKDLDFNSRLERWDDWLRTPHVGLKRHQIRAVSQRLACVTQQYGEVLLQSIPKELSPYHHKVIADRAFFLKWVESAGVTAGQMLRDYATETKLYKQLEKASLLTQTGKESSDCCKSFIDYVNHTELNSTDFLLHLDGLRSVATSKIQDRVLISSIHQAKGLEWPIVIMADLTEGRFPYLKPSPGVNCPLEDERRLFYVGCTRALEQLHVFASKGSASRFLYEANWQLSDTLGQHIYDNRGFDTLSNSRPDIANRYLDAIGSPFKVAID